MDDITLIKVIELMDSKFPIPEKEKTIHLIQIQNCECSLPLDEIQFKCGCVAIKDDVSLWIFPAICKNHITLKR